MVRTLWPRDLPLRHTRARAAGASQLAAASMASSVLQQCRPAAAPNARRANPRKWVGYGRCSDGEDGALCRGGRKKSKRSGGGNVWETSVSEVVAWPLRLRPRAASVRNFCVCGEYGTPPRCRVRLLCVIVRRGVRSGSLSRTLSLMMGALSCLRLATFRSVVRLFPRIEDCDVCVHVWMGMWGRQASRRRFRAGTPSTAHGNVWRARTPIAKALASAPWSKKSLVIGDVVAPKIHLWRTNTALALGIRRCGYGGATAVRPRLSGPAGVADRKAEGLRTLIRALLEDPTGYDEDAEETPWRLRAAS